MLDFDAYLARIGLRATDSPSWHQIHRAQATSIPFENLDSHRGIPVSLEQADIERKLVTGRRGGYCFEHNLLLASALERLGLTVERMLARVLVGGRPREECAKTHLVLRVTDADGAAWLADTGFGLGTLLDPIPFGPDPDAIYEQSGWRFRVIQDGDEVILQTSKADGWLSIYAFQPRAVQRIDIELSNWWTCTHPASSFVAGLAAAVNHDDGTRESIRDWDGPVIVTTMTPQGTEAVQQPRAAIPGTLERFGLPGFTLGPDGSLQ